MAAGAAATSSDASGALAPGIAESPLHQLGAPEANAHRGRGLALMRAMMQQVTITPGPVGTTVDMHTRIS